MTEDREFYASTVEEAVAKAAAELGVAGEEVSYEVLDEGSAGFLGLGARDARITVLDEAAHRPDTADVQEVEPLPSAAPANNDAPEGSAEPPPEEAVEAPVAVDLAPSSGDASPPEVEASEELLDEVRHLVASFLTAMGFQAGIDVYDAGEFVAADVTPDNTALFIGQKGETIDAFQYLVNLAAYKERPFVKRIVLDAEGYRQRRVEALQGMAHRMARRVIREQREVELPPMSSSERRVVHLFLRDNPGVSTHSEGSGENRRVKVLPV